MVGPMQRTEPAGLLEGLFGRLPTLKNGFQQPGEFELKLGEPIGHIYRS